MMKLMVAMMMMRFVVRVSGRGMSSHLCERVAWTHSLSSIELRIGCATSHVTGGARWAGMKLKIASTERDERMKPPSVM
jgi:hypothetical protein